ncbi:MAG TPA: DinB family protein [Candidatus Tectomicrobia bacterium]
MSLPVTIIDDNEVIIGYYPKKLIPALHLDVQVDLSGKTRWLAEKYDTVLGATVHAIQQLSNAQLQQRLPWRERWMLRDLMMHVLSFPELAWLSHQHGSMSTDDMRAANARLHHVQTSEAMAAYGDGVRQQIIAFLQSNNTAAFDRVVPAHYGGEVTVLELLTIILSHSTHHLKQAYWFIDHELGVTLLKPATDADLEGIATPAALF